MSETTIFQNYLLRCSLWKNKFPVYSETHRTRFCCLFGVVSTWDLCWATLISGIQVSDTYMATNPPPSVRSCLNWERQMWRMSNIIPDVFIFSINMALMVGLKQDTTQTSSTRNGHLQAGEERHMSWSLAGHHTCLPNLDGHLQKLCSIFWKVLEF